MLKPVELNCCPQPRFNNTARLAKTMNTTSMPAEYQRFSSKIRDRLWPACSTNASTFSPMTGSTQGIRFRINPPSKLNRIISGKPVAAAPELASSNCSGRPTGRSAAKCATSSYFAGVNSNGLNSAEPAPPTRSTPVNRVALGNSQPPALQVCKPMSPRIG